MLIYEYKLDGNEQQYVAIGESILKRTLAGEKQPGGASMGAVGKGKR